MALFWVSSSSTLVMRLHKAELLKDLPLKRKIEGIDYEIDIEKLLITVHFPSRSLKRAIELVGFFIADEALEIEWIKINNIYTMEEEVEMKMSTLNAYKNEVILKVLTYRDIVYESGCIYYLADPDSDTDRALLEAVDNLDKEIF